MKITYKEPFIKICDLTDDDILATSGNIESASYAGEEAPDEDNSGNNSPFRQGIWYILPYLLFLFTACSSADEIVSEDTLVQVPSDLTKMTFRAIMEGDDTTSENTTRAEFVGKDANGTYYVHWQMEDKINILYSDQDVNQPFSLVSTDLAHGIFKGEAKNRDEYIGLSPYQQKAEQNKTNICNVVLPTLQKATPGSFDRYAGLLMGKASKDAYNFSGDIDMYFKHVCCYIELKPMFDCQSIIISSRSPEEYLAGNLYLTYDQDPALDKRYIQLLDDPSLVNKVTLQGPIEARKTYYVAVLPGTLQNGIRVTCVGTDGRMVTKKKSTSVDLPRANYKGYTAFLADPSIVAEDGVDLGTGVLWASQNLGATAPEELGDRFAWGETIPLYSYVSDDNGIHYKASEPTENEYKDNSTDDPSSTYLGSKWHMPSQSDIQALITNCTWTYVKNYNNSGVEGYVVSGNNNQIFFPISSGVASYWTSTLNDLKTEAYQLEINESNPTKVECHSTVRRKCFYIRPVRSL